MNVNVLCNLSLSKFFSSIFFFFYDLLRPLLASRWDVYEKNVEKIVENDIT